MANRLPWRAKFYRHFGVMPASGDRARFLRNVSHENGMWNWTGDPAGFEIAGIYYEPDQVAEAMMFSFRFHRDNESARTGSTSR